MKNKEITTTLTINEDIIKLIQKEGCFDIIYDCLAKKYSTEVSVSFYNLKCENLTYDLMCYSRHIFIKNIYHKLKRFDTSSLFNPDLVEELLSYHSCFEEHYILEVFDENNNSIPYQLSEEAKKELIKMSVFLDDYKETQKQKYECVQNLIKEEIKTRTPRSKIIKK